MPQGWRGTGRCIGVIAAAVLAGAWVGHCMGCGKTSCGKRRTPTYDPNSSQDLRDKAITALKKAGDPSSVAMLVKAARRDPDAELRERAVVALGRLGRVETIEALAGIARQDTGYHVRRRAVQALGRIRSPKAASQLATLWLDPKDIRDAMYNNQVQEALISLGPMAVAALRASLKHRSYKVRWKAVEALAKVGDPSAIDDLRKLVSDPSPTVRSAAEETIKALSARK